jgi:cell division protease FtsH
MGINNQKKTFRLSLVGNFLLLLTGAGFITYLYLSKSSELPVVPYSEFLHQVEKGQVSQAMIGDRMIVYQLKKSNEDILLPPPSELQSPQQSSNNPFYSSGPSKLVNPPQTSNNTQSDLLSTVALEDPQLSEKLTKKGVVFEAAPPPKNSWLNSLLAWIVPPIIFVAAFQFLNEYNGRDGGRSLAFSKSKAKVYVEGESAKITFADVVGVEEAKTELQEIVEFLQSPDRFTKIGARIPRGVLLIGPPGTGKTLLAKAVAGEARVPFFSISASEFVELFVGTGAARVRDLFEEAKKQAPCIIFIDELDAIGKSRSSGNFYSGGNDEREQTLNQLLTEMDGFNAGDSTVIVLAATNRPETLDSALLRPGRFDRQVLVDRPDLLGRQLILEHYAKKVILTEEVNLKKVATRTPGFAAADLANLVNEAALLAARSKREAIQQADFNEAIERIIGGLEKRSRVLSDREKKIVAYHEVGHALIGAVMPGGGKVAKISIVPRGISALGYTLKMPTEDRFLMNEEEFKEQICMLLGGRSAEEIVFSTVTNGASDDLQRATTIAEKMVLSYGMSKIIGPLAYQKPDGTSFLGDNVSNATNRVVSEETARAIDDEVKQIVEQEHQRAIAIIQSNREMLETIANRLLNTEVIEGEELQSLLDQVKFDG